MNTASSAVCSITRFWKERGTYAWTSSHKLNAAIFSCKAGSTQQIHDNKIHPDILFGHVLP